MTRNDEETQIDNKRGRGRPKKVGETRKNTHTVRFDDDEEAMLYHLEVESDDTKSDILRKALRRYYKLESKKW
jgi:predicted ArsR family transcriptional regulator